MNRPVKPKAEDNLTFEDFMSASGNIQEYCSRLEEALKKTCAKLNSVGCCAYPKTPCQKNISCQECWERWGMDAGREDFQYERLGESYDANT